jgi:hypothetical protein
VRWPELIVEAVRRGPLVGQVQEPVHFQVGEGAHIGQGTRELSHAVHDAAKAADDTDPLRRERAEVRRRALGGSDQLRGGQVAGPGQVVDLIVTFG